MPGLIVCNVLDTRTHFKFVPMYFHSAVKILANHSVSHAHSQNDDFYSMLRINRKQNRVDT